MPIGVPRPGGIPIGGPMGGLIPGGGPIMPAREKSQKYSSSVCQKVAENTPSYPPSSETDGPSHPPSIPEQTGTWAKDMGLPVAPVPPFQVGKAGFQSNPA